MRLFGDICILALSLVRLPIAQQSANGVEARRSLIAPSQRPLHVPTPPVTSNCDCGERPRRSPRLEQCRLGCSVRLVSCVCADGCCMRVVSGLCVQERVCMERASECA